MSSLRDDPSNPRWLRKALREIPRQIVELVEQFDNRAIRAQPSTGEWSAFDVLAYLAEAEREDLRNVEAMIAEDGARIEEQRAHLAPGEGDFEGQSAWRLLEDFFSRREELLWNLEFVESEWQHAGTHPYRGRVPLMRYLREMTDRDLEAAITLRRLLETTGQPVGAVEAVRRRPQ
jgi:hypothetical protein